ncbi:MAG: response regulator [Gemmatimonadales bacterium]|nr:response regulator [Gemmatimonadales bacterium]
MADAGRDLQAPLEYHAAVRAAVRSPVPKLADLAALFLTDASSGRVTVEVAHRTRAEESGVRMHLLRHLDELVSVAGAVARTTHARRPQWIPRIDDRVLGRFSASTPTLLALRDALGVESLLVFPVHRTGQVIGALALGRLAGQPPFGAADLAAGSVLSQRGALAIENGRLRNIAHDEGIRTEGVRQTLQRWAQAFEHADWGAAILDASGRIEAANPALARMHGAVRPEELRGMSFGELEVTTADGVASNREGEGRQSYQATHVRRDGSTFPALVTLTNMPAEDGHNAYQVANVQDVSDMRRTEERLHRAQRMEAVGRLAGGVAHEVNNMMTVILGFADFLYGSVSPDARSDVDEIRKAAIRAASITQQLLAFGRQQLLQPTVLELETVVSEMADLLRPLLPTNVTVDTTVEGHGRVRADRAQLEQVIINLAFNARDAMPRGGRLTIGTAFRTLDESFASAQIGVATPAGRYALLTVSDTGTGMDAETQARAFEPFFTTKAVGQGTGLGLATVYGIVKQSGGFVWVDSTQGSGTKFTVCLPAVEVEAEVRHLEAPGPVESGRETILVVEDEAAVRALTQRTLREAGYAVLEAGNGREALALVEDGATRVDAVVTDVVMPDMGGSDLRIELRRLRPDLRVLSMSGYPSEEVQQRGLLGPDDPFLQKPFTPQALTRALRAVLETAPRAG